MLWVEAELMNERTEGKSRLHVQRVSQFLGFRGTLGKRVVSLQCTADLSAHWRD